MTDTPSFQDLLNDFADEVFVGRGEQLSLFEGALKASKPSFLVLNISGQGGVGKSTLLERYGQISKNNDAAHAIVTEDHLSIPKILDIFVSQLEGEGLDFKTFKERYKTYLELREKVEADPKVPSGIMDFAIRGITKVGVKSLKRVPVAGDIADVFLSPESEETIADQATEFSKYIFQKFTNKDERVLLLETDAELTRHFLADISKSTKNRKAVLCFDTYEKTANSIEKWLISLLLGEYGKFSSNVLFVISGRYELGQNWTRFRKAIRQIELKEFTDEEAKDYLARFGITDDSLVSQFIEVSERLPVLLALLVSSPNQLPHDVSGDAVQRFLQGLTLEQQEAALISSLPRFFNSDILRSILGEDEGKKAFEWLSNAHFVRTSEKGWVYHDVVRAMMLKYLYKRSREQFIKTQKSLEEYYNKNLDTEKNSKYCREKIYHFLHQNPLKNLESIARDFVGMVSQSFIEMLSGQKAENYIEDMFDEWKENYQNPIMQLSNEIAAFEADRVIEIYKSFSRFITEDSKYDLVFWDWLSEKELNDEEREGLFLIKGLIISADEQNYLEITHYYSEIIELYPSKDWPYLFRGYFYNERKEYQLAINDFTKIIASHPDKAVGCFIRGKAYFENKDFASAFVDFSKCIENSSERGDFYNWRGKTSYHMKDYASAVSDFSKALYFSPENSYYYYWRGQTYYDLEEYNKALADLSKAVDLKPEEKGFWIWRGHAYFAIEDYENAKHDYSKWIDLKPDSNGGGYYWRGRTNHELDDFPSALMDFTKAIELSSTNSSYYYRRGLTYYKMKAFPAAITDFSEAIKLQPENSNYYYWYGLTCYYMKDNPAALINFSKAVELDPEYYGSYWWRGIIYYEIEEYPHALDEFNKVIELQAEDMDNYGYRGKIYFEMKNYSAALADFSKIIELQPGDGSYFIWRGQTYHEMESYPAALDDFSKAIQIQPEDGGYFYYRGKTYYAIENYPLAIADFTKANELAPNDGYNFFWRGQTYYEMENYPAALDDFSKAIELRPEDGNNYFWRGRTYYTLKNYPTALDDFSKAIKLWPEDGDNYFGRGRTYYALKNYPDAITDFTKAVELQPKDGFNYYGLGLCNLALGNETGYDRYIKTAIKLFETNPQKTWGEKLLLALCYFANRDLDRSSALYAEIISQSSKKDLKYGLEMFRQFIDLIGDTPESKNIEKLLESVLAK